MPTAQERTTHPRTPPSCDGSHSTCFERTQSKYPCAAKSKPQPGTMASFSACSAKSDSPAREGRAIAYGNSGVASDSEIAERARRRFEMAKPIERSPHPARLLATIPAGPVLQQDVSAPKTI